MFTHPNNKIFTRILTILLWFDWACRHKSTPYFRAKFGALKPRFMSEDLRHTHFLLTVEIVWFKALTTFKKHLLQINNNYNTPVQMHV